MNRDEARKILRIYNLWRRAQGEWCEKTFDELPFDEPALGRAIDYAVAALTVGPRATKSRRRLRSI